MEIRHRRKTNKSISSIVSSSQSIPLHANEQKTREGKDEDKDEWEDEGGEEDGQENTQIERVGSKHLDISTPSTESKIITVSATEPIESTLADYLKPFFICLLLLVTVHITSLIILYWKQNGNFWVLGPVLLIIYTIIYFFYKYSNIIFSQLFLYMKKMYYSYYPRRSQISIKEIDCLQIFQRIDKDKTGFISVDDLMQVFKKLKAETLQKEEISQLIDLVDQDNDGKLNYVEFRSIFQIQP